MEKYTYKVLRFNFKRENFSSEGIYGLYIVCISFLSLYIYNNWVCPWSISMGVNIGDFETINPLTLVFDMIVPIIFHLMVFFLQSSLIYFFTGGPFLLHKILNKSENSTK